MSSPAPGTRAGRQAARAAEAWAEVRLRVVPERPARPGRAFVVLLVGVLAAGLVGLLVLNTAMQREAFRLQALTEQADAATVRQQVLTMEVERLRSPEALGRRAAKLGMVPMPGPAFLDLETGRVLGDPQPAVAGTGPLLLPPAEPEGRPDDRTGGDRADGDRTGGQADTSGGRR